MDWNLFIIPLTLIVVQLLKTLPAEDKWLPWFAVGIGGLLGLVWAVAQPEPSGMVYLEYVVQGIVYGASAAGIYDAGVSAIKSDKWEG